MNNRVMLASLFAAAIAAPNLAGAIPANGPVAKPAYTAEKCYGIAKATENAKLRAENMVKATGNKIGFMRSAKMGVFQITPVNSTEIADWGVNDTSSLDKKVTSVVNASFSIE